MGGKEGDGVGPPRKEGDVLGNEMAGGISLQNNLNLTVGPTSIVDGDIRLEGYTIDY